LRKKKNKNTDDDTALKHKHIIYKMKKILRKTTTKNQPLETQ